MIKYTGKQGQVYFPAPIEKVLITNTWDLSAEVNVLDVTAQSEAGSNARTFITDGLKNTSGSFVVLEKAASIIPVTADTSVVIELQDKHSTRRLSAIITSISNPVAVGEMIARTFNYQATGVIKEAFSIHSLALVSAAISGSYTVVNVGYVLPADAVATDKINMFYYYKPADNWVYYDSDVIDGNINTAELTIATADFGTGIKVEAVFEKYPGPTLSAPLSNTLYVYDSDVTE